MRVIPLSCGRPVRHAATILVVARVRENDVPICHLVADNEGHGFARKPNADYRFHAQVLFMQTFLLD